jgi:hypothetical protein
LLTGRFASCPVGDFYETAIIGDLPVLAVTKIGERIYGKGCFVLDKRDFAEKNRSRSVSNSLSNPTASNARAD